MQVVQSKPENLVSTFMLLMPPTLQNTVQFTHICELKVCMCVVCSPQQYRKCYYMYAYMRVRFMLHV